MQLGLTVRDQYMECSVDLSLAHTSVIVHKKWSFTCDIQIYQIIVTLANYSIIKCKTYSSQLRYGRVINKTKPLFRHNVHRHQCKQLPLFCAYLDAIFLPAVDMPWQSRPKNTTSSI